MMVIFLLLFAGLSLLSDAVQKVPPHFNKVEQWVPIIEFADGADELKEIDDSEAMIPNPSISTNGEIFWNLEYVRLVIAALILLFFFASVLAIVSTLKLCSIWKSVKEVRLEKQAAIRNPEVDLRKADESRAAPILQTLMVCDDDAIPNAWIRF